jgi:uncharacterized membrane protein
MSETRTSQLQQQLRRVSLFDSYGLPWTAHLSMGWILFLFAVTGGMAAIPIGLCLGLWLRAKTKSALVLLIYVLLAVACAILFLPNSVMTQRWADAFGLVVVVLWFAGALIGRHRIARYFTQREGAEFRLSLTFTLLFGVWYLNYRIRPEFPPDLQGGHIV